MARSKTPCPSRLKPLAAALATAFASLAMGAQPTPNELPAGGRVAAGNAAISQNAASMRVDQSTNRAIINWNTFNIGSQASVVFNQPSASAIALNRVLSSDPSAIYGRLSANGQLFLVNPAGVVFGAGSSVNTAGLVTSTLGISDQDFMSGNYRFERNGSTGSILNQGTITANGGYVALLAPDVRNEGVISAHLGSVALAAGDAVTLSFDAANKLRVAVDPSTLKTLVENRHIIQADGGTVLMASSAASTALGSVIRNTGVIEAHSIGNVNGEVVLSADKGTTLLEGAGRIDARGAADGQRGGTVRLLGDQVAMAGSSSIDVSGAAGGGTVLVGGDYLGGNPAVPNADRTYMGRDTTIKADALTSGDGGKVIVWSDNFTSFLGSIRARGGAAGGNGGFVETSGKQFLAASGRVDAGAPLGAGGTWLLDPLDVRISNNVEATDPNVYAGSIQDTLNSGTSVLITTGTTGSQTGNITVVGSEDTSFGPVNIVKSAGANASLTLRAAGSIFMNSKANISSTAGSLNVTFNARNNNGAATPSGAIFITDASIRSNGGNITLGGGVDPTATPAIGTNADTPNGIVLAGARLSSGSGNISLRGQGFAGSGSANGVRISAGTLIESTTGTITINGSGSETSPGGANNGILIEGAGTRISTANGAINLTGSGGGFEGGAGGGDNSGIRMLSGSVVESTGNGTITLTGFGGASFVAGGNTGIFMSDAGTRIRSASGAISLSGFGGTTFDGAGLNHGIRLQDGAVVESTGSATITLFGRGGASIGDFNDGISLSGKDTGIRTVNGAVALSGVGGTSALGGNFGVDIGAPVQATGSAAITITGRGGPTGADNDGVVISSPVSSTTGAITITGTGGGSATGEGFNYGVTIVDGVTSTDGAITIAGTGGIGGGDNYGFWLDGGFIQSTGSGTISVTGTGGNSAAAVGSNYGVLASGTIQSVSGAITVTGTGQGAGPDNVGVRFDADCGCDVSVAASGAGAITITGAGAGGAAGIQVVDSAVSSAGGVVNLKATTGALEIAGSTVQTTGPSGLLALQADKMTLATSTISSGAGGILLAPITAGTAVNLGSNVDTTANTLELSSTELAMFSTSGVLQIGNCLGPCAVTTVPSGPITVSADVTTNAGGGTALVSDSGGIFIDRVLTSSNGAPLTLVSGSTIAEGVDGALVTTGTLRTSSTGGQSLTGANRVSSFSADNTGAGNIVLNNATPILSIGAITNAAPGGGITVTNQGAINAGALTAPGNVNVSALAGALTLATLNTGALTATSAGALRLGQGNVNGALTATSNGAVSQNGALNVAGVSTINAGTSAIVLDAANDFAGVVNLTGGLTLITDANALTLGNVTASSLTANAAGALNLGQGVVTGNLVANSGGGAISQSGPLTVTGLSSLNAGAGAITLTNANDFQSLVNLSGGATRITDINALTLGTLATGDLTATSGGALNLGSGTVTGNLTAASNGGAVNAGVLNVTGATTIDAGANSITLTGNNDFTGVVRLTGSTIDIVDRNQLNVVANATGAVRVTGNLTYSGTSGDLTLNAIPNPDGTLTFGDTLVRGNLVATAADAVSQLAGTALNVAGTTNIDASAKGSPITLANAGNHFGGLATFRGGAINVADNAALNAMVFGSGLATLSAATAMTVSGAANGVIGNAGTTMTVGAAGLNGGTGAVRLVSPGDLTLNGAVTSAAPGDAVTLASTAGNFVNNAGASAIGVPANGRFLVYSGSPSTDVLGGLSAPNTRFGVQFGDAIAFLGSGFLYRAGPPAVDVVQPAPAAQTEQPAQAAQSLNSNFVAQQVEYDLSRGDSGLVIADRLRAGSGASDAKVADLCWTTADDQPCESDRRRARTARYNSAIEVIRKAPTVADVPLCGPNTSDVCMPTKPGIVADAEQGAPQIAIPVADVRKKVAFLIGNNDYKSDIPRLETPIADVAAIGKVLSERLGYEVTVLNNATKAGMVQALKTLAESATQHESVLIFYAGHGYQMDDTKAGFWLPADASASDPKTWLSNNDIQRFLNRIDAKQIMVVSDSCFSGTLTKEQTIDAPRSAPREQILSRRAVVTLSSGDEEPVTDEGLGGHSIFAYHFLNELQRIEKTSPISAAYERLRDRVAKAYPQTPQLGGVRSAGHMSGANYLLEVK